MDKQNLFKRLRDAMGVSHIKDMTPEEINDVFQSLHDKNEALRAENEALNNELNQALSDADKERQRAEQAEREIEAIQCVFATENDECLIDPFNSENLFKWLNKNDIEQQIKVLAWILDNREQEIERVDGLGYDAVISSFDVEQKIVELRAQLERGEV